MWYDVVALTLFAMSFMFVADVNISKLKTWPPTLAYLAMAIYTVAYPCYLLVSLAHWMFR